MANAETKSEYISVLEAAQKLRVTPRSILHWIDAGELVAVDVGKRSIPRWRIDVEDFAKFEASRKTTLKVREERRIPMPVKIQRTRFGWSDPVPQPLAHMMPISGPQESDR